MSTFITTTEISSLIEKTIKESEDFIILVTPYIQIHSRLKKIIEQKIVSSEVPLNIIYRDKISAEENSWFNNFKSQINTLRVTNLHAKCFLNEKNAILTSMNLYHYSMVNNIEFGVQFEKYNDFQNYSEILNEVINLGLSNINFKRRNTSIKQVSLKEVLKETGTTKFDFETDSKGNETFCLYKGDEKVSSIKVGSEIILKQNGEERIREVINNYTVYLIDLQIKSYYQIGLKK